MKNQALLPTLRLSLEVTNVLADIERNGIKINRTTLADIRKQYEDELFTLERRLQELAADAMGDTPSTLTVQMIALVYSTPAPSKTRRGGPLSSTLGMRFAALRRSLNSGRAWRRASSSGIYSMRQLSSTRRLASSVQNALGRVATAL